MKEVSENYGGDVDGFNNNAQQSSLNACRENNITVRQGLLMMIFPNGLEMNLAANFDRRVFVQSK